MDFRYLWEIYKVEKDYLYMLFEVMIECVIKENYCLFNFYFILCGYYKE